MLAHGVSSLVAWAGGLEPDQEGPAANALSSTPSRRPGHRGRSHHGALSSSRGGFSGCLKSAHGPTWERARAGLAAAGSHTCPRRARQALRGFARRRVSVSVREASSSPFPGKGPQQHGAAGPVSPTVGCGAGPPLTKSDRAKCHQGPRWGQCSVRASVTGDRAWGTLRGGLGGRPSRGCVLHPGG